MMAARLHPGLTDRRRWTGLALAAAVCWLAGCDGVTWPNRPTPPGGVSRPTVTFAGITDAAGSVAYVIDTTGANREAFAYAQAAVVKSLDGLRAEQRFGLVLFGARSPDPLLTDGQAAVAPAAAANRQAARRFLLTHREQGQADEGAAWRAIRAAFELEGGPPEVVFLLACRPWGEGLAERVGQLNAAAARPARIHTIGFINPQTQPLLRRIAADSGGQFRFIEAVDLGKEP